MSAKSDVKSESKISMANFKPFAAPRRKAGLRDDQIAVSKHGISLPVSMVTKLGEKVSLLFSDQDRALAIQRDTNGGYKLQVGKNKNSRAVYCKTFIEAKKVKSGRYTTTFDEKTQMLIARLT